ncbi:LysR substrate-binding domain-containing protein [Pseudomonas tolaasii]|uniref:LysR substrate-binding domain-containing protein n=1 Tax=Pseudomonas tolaasii TaxID=29442 RepID=UPI0002D78919|nr:LysR substrate-binding domain-containing protein [Pseudomonas tolaasii]MBW1245835.1 LysR family transcriptional regulator [Pseudomonas tolaasii]MBW4792367.1 LysR family transcriptional regulator [Pseudomonas tolaasii]NVZ47034.1 LysR family transcriptional regulator [Pseudomonas tolaasii]NWA51504.1 LysR family transcriptional regulator [Pseudomonas tolaasii]NWC25537.1 LysR family transcriptional regulator [Pseudomonas tolaasii]
MKLPPLAALRAFEALARLGKVNLAALELHVTHSAVSHQIRSLEEYLDIALVTRHKRTLLLTEEGRVYAYQIRQALGEIAGVTEKLVAKARHPQLTLSVLPSYAMYWLLPRLQGFMSAHPGFRLKLESSMEFASFEQGLIDCAIRFGHGQWADVQCEPLMADTLIVVAAPHFNAGVLPDTAHDILHQPLLHASESWPVWLSAAGVEGQRPQASLEFTDSTQLLEAVRLGYGIALTRRSIAHSLIQRGDLVKLTDIEPAHSSRYYLVWPAGSQRSAQLNALQQWLKDEAEAFQASL